MSLRVRLVVAVIAVLIVSLCAGGGLAVWNAGRTVATEMQAAMFVSAHTLANGIAENENPVRMIHAFDGDRHVRAVLLGRGGSETAASALRPPDDDVPEWFAALLRPAPHPEIFALPEGGQVELRPDPSNEIGEVWGQLLSFAVTAGLSAMLSILLIAAVIRQALRPLDRLVAALDQVRAGQYSVHVEPAGPPEIASLAHGINSMAEHLNEARLRNLRLNEQLETLQEEERADIARDLHDEVGPLLFAVTLDASAVEQAAGSGEIAERAHAIRDAANRMRRHVRTMLNRLHPANPAEAGLEPALSDLLAFWRGRRPGIVFDLAICVDDDPPGSPRPAVIYRLVQESLSNAIRHGEAGRIVIRVESGADDWVLVRVEDDGVGIDATSQLGLGLIGMRERVEALGGTLQVGSAAAGSGVAVVARLPASGARRDEPAVTGVA